MTTITHTQTQRGIWEMKEGFQQTTVDDTMACVCERERGREREKERVLGPGSGLAVHEDPGMFVSPLGHCNVCWEISPH